MIGSSLFDSMKSYFETCSKVCLFRSLTSTVQSLAVFSICSGNRHSYLDIICTFVHFQIAREAVQLKSPIPHLVVGNQIICKHIPWCTAVYYIMSWYLYGQAGRSWVQFKPLGLGFNPPVVNYKICDMFPDVQLCITLCHDTFMDKQVGHEFNSNLTNH